MQVEDESKDATPHEPKGFGDTIAKLTEALGLDKLAEDVAQAIGKNDCGCNKRRRRLNELFPYKK